MTKKCNYNFSAEKNYKLISERKVSFEEIISVIENGCLLYIIEHPNSIKYSNQKMHIVKFNEYTYLVPFVIEVDGTTFLKTIIPSRKATQEYLKAEKRMRDKDNIVLDTEEKELLDSFENSEWQRIENFEQEKNIAQDAATNYLKKDIRINIRISSSDLRRIN